MSAFAGPGGSETPLTEAAIAVAGDNRYARKSLNLSDLPDKTAALATLNGTSKTIVVANGADLNTVVQSGFYRLSGSLANSPNVEAEFGQMIVCRGSDTIFQIIVPYTGSKMWFRGGNPPETGGTGTWKQWSEGFSRSSILGVVSQSGGLPTGALFEYGSNANGKYWKYADGLLICTGSMTVAGTTGSNWSSGGSNAEFAYTNGAESWTAPATFIDVPEFSCQAVDGAVSARSAYVTFIAPATTGLTSIYLAAPIPAANAGNSDIKVRIIAVGRWF